MWPPPLFRDRHLATQIILAVVAPIAFGAVCGCVLGASALGYNALMLAGGVGGTLGGFEHVGARAGLRRGLAGGVLFATSLAVAFEARGIPALAYLPAPVPIMAIGYAIMGLPFGVLGGWLRARQRSTVGAGQIDP